MEASDLSLYTPIEQAVEELRRRRTDRRLMQWVADELQGDIPSYLLEHECFVLPRHIATPNNEALYVLEEAGRFGVTAIFSQDLRDRFTSVNNLKRRLARPEICSEGASGPTYRKIDLVDVPAVEGRLLSDVMTRDGRPLAAVHNALFGTESGRPFRIVDDADWIDRHHRGDMAAHYRAYLLLFLAHGVLFEEFEGESDYLFKANVLSPIIDDITGRFDINPLIVKSVVIHSSHIERYYISHRHDVEFRSILS